MRIYYEGTINGMCCRLDMRYAREKSRMNSELFGLRKEVTEMQTTIGRVSLTCRSSVLVMLV